MQAFREAVSYAELHLRRFGAADGDDSDSRNERCRTFRGEDVIDLLANDLGESLLTKQAE